jgi:hypothetical protein
VGRFLTLHAAHPGHFDMAAVVIQMTRIVSLGTIAQQVHLIEMDHRPHFVRLLCSEDWSPARGLLDRTSEQMVLVSARDGEASQAFSIRHSGIDTTALVDRRFNAVRKSGIMHCLNRAAAQVAGH